MSRVGAFVAGVLVTAGLCAASGRAGAAVPDPAFPYAGPAFTAFVKDSYANAGGGDPGQFFRWMDARLADPKTRKALAPTVANSPAWAKKNWSAVATAEAARHKGMKGTKERIAEERRFAAALHRAVKTVIPKFSLDRGFEFVNTVKYGERQCYLQSVVVAGMLQASDIPAGVAMVYVNDKGAHTNNGHAVAVARLSDGTGLIVDCSDPTPFIRHEGLMLRDGGTGDYRYLEPIFRSPADSVIVAYRPADGGANVKPGAVAMLDTGFLNSQFDYYRGERTPGGFLAPRPTAAGLAGSAKHLERAVKECPRNPLAVYVLGRVYLKQGRRDVARRQIQSAYALYRKFGWVPPGEREALALVGLRTADAR
jgi:hypothetical protein